MEIRLQTWLCHAGTVGCRVCPRPIGVAADGRLALLSALSSLSLTGPTRSSPSCDQQPTQGHSTRLGAGSKSRMLIEQWGRLHTVRSVLGLAATLVFFFCVMLRAIRAAAAPARARRARYGATVTQKRKRRRSGEASTERTCAACPTFNQACGSSRLHQPS